MGRYKKHGHCTPHNSPTYRSWLAMLYRCTNQTYGRFKDYGGRGIKVCQRWMEFASFLEDMGERPVGLTIERKDNLGNYCPENCVWGSPKAQARNRRSNVNLTYNGRTQCISKWAEETGIERQTIQQRLRRGWTVEQSLEVSPCGTHRKIL